MDTISKFYEAAAPAPKYRMLAQAIRDAIAHNALSAGDRLPPVRDLAWHLGITPGTVARAYTVLTDDKVLTAEVGRGTFVSLPNSAVADDVWNRQVARMTNGLLNLFAPQLPDVGQVALMRDAMGRIGEADPLRLMTYPTRASHLPARRAAAHWLRGLPLGGLDPDDVVLTHGGQSGIVTVLQTLLHGPRPVILVEDLSYAGFRRAAELLRAEVVGDGEGSALHMHLHYGGALWTGGLMERALTDQITAGRERLSALVSA